MSLNSVVNNLVRAAASIPADISDADLDRHVAALLAEEAKAKEVKWTELGLGAWTGNGRDSCVLFILCALPPPSLWSYLRKWKRGEEGANGRPDPNAPKPNKRFLAAVIKNVDGHNRDLLRSQAEAARDIRRSRGEEDTRGSSSRRLGGRLFGGAMAGLVQNGSTKGKERERAQERDAGGWEERYFAREGEKERRRGGEGRGGSLREERSSRSKRYEDGEDEDRRRRRRSRDRDEDDRDRRKRRERSHEHGSEERDRRKRRDRSYEHDSEDRARHRQKERDEDNRDRRKHRTDDVRDRRKERQSERERAERLAREKRYEHFPDWEGESSSAQGKRSPPPPPPLDSPPPSPSPPPMPSPISKMDKYFNTSYDPRLDLGEVPREGMIVNVGWDNMLAVLKERGKKRRIQSPGLSPDPYDVPAGLSIRSPSPDLSRRVDKMERKKRKEDRKRRKGALSDESEEEREKRRERKRKEKEHDSHLASTSTGTTNGDILGMEYVKKGGTREWDKGK